MGRLSRTVWGIVAFKLALHLGSSAQGYGLFGDELYYLACADHLDLGYVDHPPLSIWLLEVWRAAFGDSLFALRALTALFGAGAVLCAGLLARDLGGGRTAQSLTALAAALVPVNLVVHGYYSMNAIDIFVWGAAFVLIGRLLRTASRGRWLWLGFLLGLGLLNKFSVLWLGAGFFLGLLATPHRRLLMSPWPWLAGALAFAMLVPHLLWQFAHDWPTAEFMRVATTEKMLPVGPVQLLGQQILVMNPLLAPVWIAGLFLLLRGKQRSGPERVYAAVFLTTAAILIANGTSRPNFLALAQLPLIAAGSIGLERLGRARWRWLPPAYIALFTAVSLVAAPLAVPLLPVHKTSDLQAFLGIEIPQMEDRQEGAILPHFAEMHGWATMAATTAEVWQTLSDDERSRAAIFAGNYTVGAAVDRYGREHGLPPVIGGHNSYWLWGPRDTQGEVMLLLGGKREDYAPYWENIERTRTWDCSPCLPGRIKTIWIARDLKQPFSQFWLDAREYH